MNLPRTHSPAETVLIPSSDLVHHDNPNPQRLGVFVNERGGLDIAVVAAHAAAVDFCILEGTGKKMKERRWTLRGPVEGIWHGTLNGYFEGTVYGFRVFGPWDPDGGLYHNPSKLLLDPYGRGVIGEPDLVPAIHAHQVDHELYPSSYPLTPSPLNSALYVPHSVVVNHRFPVRPGPRTPWSKTVIYEMHVKGFSKNLAAVPGDLQGTYAGLAHPASIKHLQDLGVTAIELLPVHAKMDEPFLTERGLTNYWGYSTLSFFAPEPSLATAHAQAQGPQAVADEFRGMVSLLHEAGIEVLLDVVYNHTCEGGDAGQSLCWRGLDSLTYYRYTNDRPRRSIDDTGCGNTLNFSSPRVVQMTLDSLRYWVKEMGIDGFRFDLASTLGRLDDGYTPNHPLFVAMAADPVLRQVKLIAEPWDIGPGGWQTGNFPIPFSEWNDRYRDSVRNFWLADFQSQLAGHAAGGPQDLATRLSGSADLFGRPFGPQRGPRASVNFVAAHDGFTLADLTAYEHKHNMANLENNQDGSSHNRSWNHGIEGIGYSNEFGDLADSSGLVEDILYARERSRRNMLTTIAISAGTPMIVAGDEFARTQYGNNNAYCQDSPISWINWDLTRSQTRLLNTTGYLLALRNQHPVMRPDTFMTGQPIGQDSMPALSWLWASGKRIPADGWNQNGNRVFQMRRSGRTCNDVDLLVAFNGTLQTAEVTLADSHGNPWVLVVDTSWMRPKAGGIQSAATALGDGEQTEPGTKIQMEPQSMQVYFSSSQGPIEEVHDDSNGDTNGYMNGYMNGNGY